MDTMDITTTRSSTISTRGRDRSDKPANGPRKSYQAMVLEAVIKLDDRGGSSLQSIRKFILTNFDVKRQHTASFNNMTLKGALKAVSMGELEKVKNSFKLTAQEKDRRKKGATVNILDADGEEETHFELFGTAAQHNKLLRKQLLDIKQRRESYLESKLEILTPFLPDKKINYFVKRIEQQRQQHHVITTSNHVYSSNRVKNIDKLNNKHIILPFPATEYGLPESTESDIAVHTTTSQYSPHNINDNNNSVESRENISVLNGNIADNTSQNCIENTLTMVDNDNNNIDENIQIPITDTASNHILTDDETGSNNEVLTIESPSSPLPSVSPIVTMPLIKTETLVINVTSNIEENIHETDGKLRLDSTVVKTMEEEVYLPPIVPIDLPVIETSLTLLSPPTPPPTSTTITMPPSTSTSTEKISTTDNLALILSTPANELTLPLRPASQLPSMTNITAATTTTTTTTARPVEEKVEVRFPDSQPIKTISSGILPTSTPDVIPKELVATLHEHQVAGISWMVQMFEYGMPMILGDQMGLGKTIQSIGFIASLLYSKHQSGPFLIVVPLSVLSNWMVEIERFCPSLRAVRLHGPKAERNRIKSEELADLHEFDVVVTTYEMLVAESNYLKRKYVWTAIIIDEGHRLKNERSQLSDKLSTVPALNRVILTGTPLQNNLRELWAMLHFLLPEVFTVSSAEKFEYGFDLGKGRIDSSVLRKARKLLSVFMLRRIKEQIALKLPPRREFTVMVPLTESQIMWYKQLLSGLDAETVEAVMRNGTSDVGEQQQQQQLQSVQRTTSNLSTASTSSSTDSEWRRLMNLLLQLRKVCNHIYLLPGGAPDPYEVNDDIIHGSGKLRLLDRMLPRLRQDAHRVLLFSQFTSTLDILEDYCEFREFPFVRLDGSTNRVQRRLDMRRYNAPNSKLFIFLISTRAGGLGLNLASADTVILYDSDWNPQVDLQAMERAHRIGQTKPVTVFRLVSRGSVEERMIARAGKKLYLNAMVGEKNDEDENGGLDDLGNDLLDIDIGNDDDKGGGVSKDSFSGMSKSELASLIRYGANAILEGSVGEGNNSGNSSTNNVEISDTELDRLLGRVVQETENATNQVDVKDGDVLLVTVEEAQQKQAETLLARLHPLAEVDLRQFQNVMYEKKKGTSQSATQSQSTHDISLILDTKRVKKERVVLMDGTGSGYGGDVPVLVESLANSTVVARVPESKKRERNWTNMEYCALCGRAPHPVSKKKKRKGKELEPTPPPIPLCACSYCPLAFHTNCLEAIGLFKMLTSFSCPQHRCSMCSRATAAAGGMLFRCTGCLTAYCEDCLPQDDVDGEGENEILDNLGYKSKQAYFIRCLSCKSQLPEVAVPMVTEELSSSEVPLPTSSDIIISNNDIHDHETAMNVDNPPESLISLNAQNTLTIQTMDTDEGTKIGEGIATLPNLPIGDEQEVIIDVNNDKDKQMEEEVAEEDEEVEEEGEELAILPSQTWIIHPFIPDVPSPPKIKKSQLSKTTKGSVENKKKRESTFFENMEDEGVEGGEGRRRSGRLASKYLEVKKDLALSKKEKNATMEDSSSNSSSSDEDDEEEEVAEGIISSKKSRIR